MNRLLRKLLSFFQSKTFTSNNYWEARYAKGHNSGQGSYGRLAEFKARTLNKLVAELGINSVIEFGSGDGNQLTLSTYPEYVGYDVSQTAIDTCRKRFNKDNTKQFYLASEYDGRKADMTLSLDVIYHLVEDDVFNTYMENLFNSAKKVVAIYSSNQNEPIEPVSIHVRHRKFTDWVTEKAEPNWKLKEHISNPYPYDAKNTDTTWADFYIYIKNVTGPI